MPIPLIRSGDGNLSLVIHGRQYHVLKDEPHYNEVLDAIRNDHSEDEVLVLMNKIEAAKRYIDNQSEIMEEVGQTIIIKDGSIFYTEPTGELTELHGTMVNRLFELQKERLPINGLLNFITRIMENPSASSINELYDFLDHKSLPICDDGCFLAYKAVREDFKDKYSGTIDNSIGSVVRVRRSTVDDDRTRGCSTGLHAGTIDYVLGYGNECQNDKFLIVKIDPKHVVSVPKHDCQKLRTCEYTVLREYDGELSFPMANQEGRQWNPEEDEAEVYDYNDEMCDECHYDVQDCVCDDICGYCSEHYDDCECE